MPRLCDLTFVFRWLWSAGYNSTDVDFYTNVGHTISVSGGHLVLLQSSFGTDPDPDRGRRLQFGETVAGGLAVAYISHRMGWS